MDPDDNPSTRSDPMAAVSLAAEDNLEYFSRVIDFHVQRMRGAIHPTATVEVDDPNNFIRRVEIISESALALAAYLDFQGVGESGIDAADVIDSRITFVKRWSHVKATVCFRGLQMEGYRVWVATYKERAVVTFTGNHAGRIVHEMPQPKAKGQGYDEL